MHGVHRRKSTIVITVLLLMPTLLIPRLGWTCESTKSRQVADLLVANQVAAAEALLDHFAEQQPNDPMLAIYRGAVLWVKAKNASKEQRPEAQQKAVDALQHVIDGESQTLQADPEQPQRQLSLGIAEALVARIYMQQKKWFKAYRYGRRARDGLRELIAQHPDREDAYLVLGLYEYHAGTIPPIWKWAAAMLDFAGDAQRGIQYLERAIQNAPIVAPEAARVLLTEIKPPQPQACDYLPLAQYMREHYGTNLRFSFALQDLYIMCGQPQKTLNEVRYAKKRFLPQHPQMQTPLDVRTLIAYRELGDMQHIDAMATQLKSRPLIWTLNKAKTADIIGDRETATDLYATLTDDDHAPRWIQKQAQQYRKHPYQRYKTQHPQREIELNTRCS